jgi:hypothetical protein
MPRPTNWGDFRTAACKELEAKALELEERAANLRTYASQIAAIEAAAPGHIVPANRIEELRSQTDVGQDDDDLDPYICPTAERMRYDWPWPATQPGDGYW